MAAVRLFPLLADVFEGRSEPEYALVRPLAAGLLCFAPMSVACANTSTDLLLIIKGLKRRGGTRCQIYTTEGEDSMDSVLTKKKEQKKKDQKWKFCVTRRSHRADENASEQKYDSHRNMRVDKPSLLCASEAKTNDTCLQLYKAFRSCHDHIPQVIVLSILQLLNLSSSRSLVWS